MLVTMQTVTDVADTIRSSLTSHVAFADADLHKFCIRKNKKLTVSHQDKKKNNNKKTTQQNKTNKQQNQDFYILKTKKQKQKKTR